MKYKIKYYYRTGDSFHTEDSEELLEYEWEDLEVAKECLKRIKEHYTWYQYTESPRWIDEVPKPEWHNIKADSITKDMEYHLINIPTDNGKEVQFWPPWCGYFEELYGAEIIGVDDGLSFEVN